MSLENKLPQCPIHREIEGKHLETCDLIVYGHQSNDCTKCLGADNYSCEIYKIWYHTYLTKLSQKFLAMGD